VAARRLRIDTGVAVLPLPGQSESGDLSLVKRVGSGVFVAVVDGLGHGQEAASAAHAAVATLDRYAKDPLPELLKRTNGVLSGTRGVVLTIAYLDPAAKTMTWLGIGNVEGVLIHADGNQKPARVSLVPTAGFVGGEVLHAQPRVVPIARGDTLILATDGIKSGFADGLPPAGLAPQALADQILSRFAKGTDDALVLVARYVGG
jgi:negative regulator of sigma-B (phosphoserine phosphatase)